MNVWLIRDTIGPWATLGKLYVDGVFLGHTAEDKDRFLEIRPEDKVYGRSAIPAGGYPLVLSMSARFKREMPEILNVHGFNGIRIHAGNYPDDPTGNGYGDSLGCPLLGKSRGRNNVFDCKAVNDELIKRLEESGPSWIIVGREPTWKQDLEAYKGASK
jgi:hypothetical protein